MNIIHAVMTGELDEVKNALANGADVNGLDMFGRTALHIASKEGKHYEIVEELIRSGINVHALDQQYRNTALHIAAKYNTNLKTIQKLINVGIDIHAKEIFDKTALHFAAEKGTLEINKELLKNGANVNAEDKNKSTPLHFAAEKNSLEVNQELLKNGANALAKDKNGGTPLHGAAEYSNNPKVIQELLDSGVDVHVLDNDLRTPLHISKENKNVNIAIVLAENGANLNAPDRDGETPLDSEYIQEALKHHIDHIAARERLQEVTANKPNNVELNALDVVLQNYYQINPAEADIIPNQTQNSANPPTLINDTVKPQNVEEQHQEKKQLEKLVTPCNKEIKDSNGPKNRNPTKQNDPRYYQKPIKDNAEKKNINRPRSPN